MMPRPWKLRLSVLRRIPKRLTKSSCKTQTSLDSLTKDIVSKSDMKAKAEQEKVEAETEHESVMGEIEQLMNENADLHKSCDFTLKNFELRQTARDDEIEALKQALAMFSGASFSAFLQQE